MNRRLLRVVALLRFFAVYAMAMLTLQLAGAAQLLQKMARVGFVHPQSPSTATAGANAFWERLRELGYI